jgi:hypothetical protein
MTASGEQDSKRELRQGLPRPGMGEKADVVFSYATTGLLFCGSGAGAPSCLSMARRSVLADSLGRFASELPPRKESSCGCLVPPPTFAATA